MRPPSAIGSGSLGHVVVFFEHRCELAHQRFQPRILPLQARFAVGLPMDFEGTERIAQELIAPLIVLCLADLAFIAQLGHGSALKLLQHRQGLRLRIPFSSFHSCFLIQQPQLTQVRLLFH